MSGGADWALAVDGLGDERRSHQVGDVTPNRPASHLGERLHLGQADGRIDIGGEHQVRRLRQPRPRRGARRSGLSLLLFSSGAGSDPALAGGTNPNPEAPLVPDDATAYIDQICAALRTSYAA